MIILFAKHENELPDKQKDKACMYAYGARMHGVCACGVKWKKRRRGEEEGDKNKEIKESSKKR